MYGNTEIINMSLMLLVTCLNVFKHDKEDLQETYSSNSLAQSNSCPQIN